MKTKNDDVVGNMLDLLSPPTVSWIKKNKKNFTPSFESDLHQIQAVQKKAQIKQLIHACVVIRLNVYK